MSTANAFRSVLRAVRVSFLTCVGAAALSIGTQAQTVSYTNVTSGLVLGQGPQGNVEGTVVVAIQAPDPNSVATGMNFSNGGGQNININGTTGITFSNY